MSGNAIEQLRNWPAQREQRRQLGDDLAVPRLVDHFVVFKKKAAVREAAEAYAERGFDIQTFPALLSTTVQASRLDALTDENVSAMVHEVVGIAEAHGGSYDGFGGPVVA
jgi:hypothetical protein